MKKCKFFSTVLLSIALFLNTLLQQPLQSHAEEARVKSDAYQEEFMDFTGSTLRCAYHSQSEIVAFMKSHPTQYLSGYSVEPSTTAPYAIGRPTDAVLQDALNTLNAIRYVAGLPGNVRLNEEYYQKTQAGALINAVNGGLSHSPSQPSDMSDELYNLAYSGASCSTFR